MGDDIEVVLAKAADVITYVENGVCDLGVVGKEVWNAWADARLEEKIAQLTDKEKDLVKIYCADIPGERCEATVRIFSQIMFIAPQIRLSEAQAQAGGKSYTYYYTVESAVPM